MVHLPFHPHTGRTKVCLHLGQEHVSFLDGFVEGEDGGGGSGLLLGYPAGPSPVGDRMRASQALQPPLSGCFLFSEVYRVALVRQQ